MRLKNAKKYLPFVQAAAEGKTIQYRASEEDKWKDLVSSNSFAISKLNFDYDSKDEGELRIKPEPKLRPWKPEEGVGKVVRLKLIPSRITMITDFSGDDGTFCAGLTYWGVKCDGWVTPEYLLERCTQLNGLPCGVEESA